MLSVFEVVCFVFGTLYFLIGSVSLVFGGVYLVFGGVYLVNRKGSILEIQHKRRYHTKGAIGSRYLSVLEDPKS